MFKKICILLFLLMCTVGFTMSTVSAGTGRWTVDGYVGKVYKVSDQRDIGNRKYGSCDKHIVEAFERSGLFTEKKDIDKWGVKHYENYVFTAAKAGSATIKVWGDWWVNPDYYIFHIRQTIYGIN